MKKEPKKKPYRSALENALWSFQGMARQAPLSFLLMALEVPMNVFLAYAEIYLPALAVSLVTSGALFETAVKRVGLFILAVAFISALQHLSNAISRALLQSYRFLRTLELDKKSMELFYQTYEKKEIRDLSSRASLATQMGDGEQPISDMPKRCLKLVENLICYCLFGTIISAVSPWLLLLLTAAPFVNWFCARAFQRWEYSHRELWTDLDRRLWYVQNMPADFTAAKDIRIYGMAGWLKDIFLSLSRTRSNWDKKLALRKFLSRLADLLIILLRDGTAYAVLIKMSLSGAVTVGEFVLYFAAISSFSSYVGNIMNEWSGMHSASLKVCDFREYMELCEEDTTGSEPIEPHLLSAPKISFEHVSFRYDGAESDTLTDISFTMMPGEKIALVGLNGAGKTTLVKLLCGLYRPTHGCIKLNGIPIQNFRRQDYYRLLSPVFQDVRTAYFSLAETVSGKISQDMDSDRVLTCLRHSGLGEKIDSLPKGIHTGLDKQINKDGIELSGGEIQKLMLARALYKDAPLLVLDEPTAALDPISEYEIYSSFNEIAGEKTAVYISHRLASCRFCDKIAVFSHGFLIQLGSHAALLSQDGGKYAELWQAQAQYYT